MSEKNYRIKANVGGEQVIKASLSQDIGFLEVLSLKINQEDAYKLHVSNYGIIVGRVLANEAFGVPNAKVSVFIQLSDEDANNQDIINLYPYKYITTLDKDQKRYNLLSDSSSDECVKTVGTFPNKRLVLDNDTEIEIYEKYWKYTTVTNQSGDYMIFGVPTGNQTVHVDIDLSDIGLLSQKPRDFFYKGYNKEQFDSAEQFKDGTNLDNLTQLLTQNNSVYVHPFFGDKDLADISITRCDVQVPYKFEPTCVFFGSVISDKKGQHIGHACAPTSLVGTNANLVTGEGVIEMIRKTTDGLVEEFPIKSNRLIDGDGVWCYQIPMNLDYIGTDEFGNIIPIQDSKKGIPTRTSVRFRFSMQETESASTSHTAKYLVPNVHELDANEITPKIHNGSLYDKCYEFGSATPNEYFRDLLWNKVYTVKNYIPRFEREKKGVKKQTKQDRYSGIKTVNGNHDNNVFPFNTGRFRIKFNYLVLCTLMKIVVDVVGFYNALVSTLICKIFNSVFLLKPFAKMLSKVIKCVGFKGEWFFEDDNNYYFPKCKDCQHITDNEGLNVVTNKEDLLDLIQQNLAMEYDIVHLDFANDWINGTLYFPLWFHRKRAARSMFFGLFKQKSSNEFCSCDKKYDNFVLSQGFDTTYDYNFSPVDIGKDTYNGRHKDLSKKGFKFGVIKQFTNKDGLNVYYYAPGVPLDTDYKSNIGPTNYIQLFSTDIVLLGSLNSCDIDNLPKTFDSLPSTTVNLPFISSISVDDTDNNIITGIDWGEDGDKDNIKYQDGLFFDLDCWSIKTRYKSGVNLSRLSELGVTFDMDMISDDPNVKSIKHDGLITEDELVEHETRAKFASLNHNGLKNMVKNVTTNYDTYKFHYIYPVNFDGHLGPVEKIYNTPDISDGNYIMYRLGEGKDSSNGRHKKHFYNDYGNKFNFPLFNNSFYFYFGLKNGKTAIDKFNTLYNAVCVKQNKYPFTMEYQSKPGKWCYNPDNIKTDFGTIDIEFEGLTDTFSYSLYNNFNELLISETDVRSNDLRFGYQIATDGGSYVTSNSGYAKDGRLVEFKTGKPITNSLGEYVFLENGVYYLEVTNSFGMKITEKINLIQNTLSPNIEEIKLGTKFINGETNASDICGEMDFYGELIIKSFIVDGEEVFITKVDSFFLDGVDHYYVINNVNYYPQNGEVVYNNIKHTETQNGEDFYVEIDGKEYKSTKYEQPNEITCQVTCSDSSKILLILEPENDETQDISNFMCFGVGNVPSLRTEDRGEGTIRLIFNIWKPGDYVLTSNQLCNNVMNDNVSVNTFSIENGEKFQAFINGIPFKIIHNDYFNNKRIIGSDNANVTDSFPRVWLQLENPNIYTFGSTLYKDIAFWDDFLNVVETTNQNNVSIISSESKLDIIQFQLETIARLRDIAYIMGENDTPQINITTNGGKEPILIRSIHPDYTLLDETNDKCEKVIIENNNSLEAPSSYPHIVDKRYQKAMWWDYNNEYYSIRVNKDVYGKISPNIGNYFAAFTNNGGMVDIINGNTITSEEDKSLFVESIPTNANPLRGITTKSTILQNDYPKSILSGEEQYNPYLRTMFVDKRLIFDGDFLLPVPCMYDIYNNDDYSWTNGKFDVTLYNTAPLIYDEEYNILGDNLSYTLKYENEEGKWDNLTHIDQLNNDTDVKLVSNLTWYVDNDNSITQNDNGKLYVCSYNVDGLEFDIKDELQTYSYGSEMYNGKHNEFISYAKHRDGALTVPFGESFEIEAANCKMLGDLSVEKVTYSNNEEKYLFKSYIQGGELHQTKINIGNRVDVLSSSLLYNVGNGNKYVIWDNQKVYINNAKEKLLTYKYSNTKNVYYVEINQLPIELTKIQQNYYYYDINEVKISGYTWWSKSYLNMTKNEIEKQLSTNNMQTILNKYGVPIYAIYDNNTVFYTFDPHTPGKTKTITQDGLQGLGGYTIQSGETQIHVYDYYAINIGENKNIIFTAKEIESVQMLDQSPIFYPDINGVFYEERKSDNKLELPLKVTLGEDNLVTYYEEKTYKVRSSALVTSNNAYDNKNVIETTEHVSSYLLNDSTGNNFYEKQDSITIIDKLPNTDKEIGVEINNGNRDEPNFGENTFTTLQEDYVSYQYCCEYIDGSGYTNYILFESSDVVDGETTTINFSLLEITVTFEKNEINGRYYAVEEKNGEKTYYKLLYLYHLYEYNENTGYYSSGTYCFYEGTEINLFGKTVLAYNVKPHSNGILNVKITKGEIKIDEIQTTSISINGESIVTIQVPYTTTSGNTIQFNITTGDSRNLKIHEEFYNNYIVSSVEDFSCSIAEDMYNEDFNSIDTNAPFLSCSVIKKYDFDTQLEFEKQIGDTCTINKFTTTIPNNVSIENNEITNVLLLQDIGMYVSDNEVNGYSSLYIPKHNSDGYLVDSNNNVITWTFEVSGTNINSGDGVNWCDTIILVKALNGETEILTKENKKLTWGKQENLNLDIVWEKIDFNIYKLKYSNESNERFDSFQSIKKEFHVSKKQVNIETFGENSYLTGKINIKNIFSENINNIYKRYNNTNLLNSIPYTSNQNVKFYRTKSPVIGEMYGYFNRNLYSTIDESNIFRIKEEYGNKTPGIGSIGVGYGNYNPLPIQHYSKINHILYKNEFNNIASFNTLLPTINERMGTQTFVSKFYNNDGSSYNIYENNEVYKDMIYVHQPFSNNEILDGTEVMSCNFVKVYYDTNDDYTYNIIPTFSQSFNFHVGNICLGECLPIREGDNFTRYELPLYHFDGLTNEDVKQSIENGTIKYYFNNEEYDSLNVVSGSSSLSIAKLYSSYDINEKKPSNQFGVLHDYTTLTRMLSNGNCYNVDKNLYLMEYDSDVKFIGDVNIRPYYSLSANTSSDDNVYVLTCTMDSIYEDTKNSIKTCFSAATQDEFDVNGKTTWDIYSKPNNENTFTIKLFGERKIKDQNDFFNYSLFNGESNLSLDGNNKDVSLTDIDSINTKMGVNYSNKIFNSFSNVWKKNIKISIDGMNPNNDNILYLESLSKDNLTTLNEIYSSGTTNEFFDKILEICNSYIINGKSTLEDMFDESFVITIALPFRFYYINGKTYKVESTSASTVNINGVNIDEVEIDGLNEYYIELSGVTYYSYNLLKVNNIIKRPYISIDLSLNDPYTKTSIKTQVTTSEEIKYIFKTNTISISKYEDNVYTIQNGITNDSTNVLNNMLDKIENGEMITIYENRAIGYPVSVIDKEKEEHWYSNNFIAFKSNLLNGDDGNIFELNALTSYYVYDSEDLLTIEYKRNNEIESDDIIILPLSIAELSSQSMVRILCEDGYNIIGSQFDKVTCVGGDGAKQTIDFDDLLSYGALGLYLCHIENIDGKYYEFLSKINGLQEVKPLCNLSVNAKNLDNTTKNVPLTINVNGIMYKLPYHCNNNTLKPGFKND